MVPIQHSIQPLFAICHSAFHDCHWPVYKHLMKQLNLCMKVSWLMANSYASPSVSFVETGNITARHGTWPAAGMGETLASNATLEYGGMIPMLTFRMTSPNFPMRTSLQTSSDLARFVPLQHVNQRSIHFLSCAQLMVGSVCSQIKHT